MARDIHQDITDSIVAKLEEGALPWRKDWHGATLDMPRRANGEYYKGINVLLLWISAMTRGYTADQWMTFKQAKELGGAVRKGEKGTGIVFYKTLELEDDNGDKRKVPMARQYTVFNVQQIDGLPASYAAPVDQVDTGARPVADIQAFFDAIPVNLVEDGTQPRYVPARDVVYMPPVHAFETAQGYYGTLAHELVHWTGHNSRLDRLGDADNRKEYAFEELVAELGACFTCAAVGGAPDLDNSAAYIGSWLRALKDDKKFIFKAAAAAQRAADYLMDAAAAADTAAAA